MTHYSGEGERKKMPTKHARLNVVMEKPLFHAVASLAKETGLSLSHMARDLIRDAVEYLEDANLTRLAEIRAKRPARLFSLEELESRLKK